MPQDPRTKMGQGMQVRLRRIRPANRATSEPPKGILRNALTSTPKPVTLRRPKVDVGIVTKTKMIQENLKTLERNTEKKRIAQAFYYGETGQSPLTRTANSSNEQIKEPVHTRLGNKVRLHRFPLILNNNRIIKSKNRFQRSNTGVRHLFSAQGRIQKIREQQISQRQNIVGNQQVVSARSNKIRLQRTRPIAPLKPTNLTVQVNNNKKSARFDNNSSEVAKHSPLGSLNPKLQAEIKFLQRSCGARVPLDIACEPIYVEGVGNTGVSLHERFSML